MSYDAAEEGLIQQLSSIITTINTRRRITKNIRSRIFTLLEPFHEDQIIRVAQRIADVDTYTNPFILQFASSIGESFVLNTMEDAIRISQTLQLPSHGPLDIQFL